MSKTIVFFSTKGGVGTTTVSFNAAVSLSLEKKKVLFLSLNVEAPLDASRMHKVKINKSMVEMVNVWVKIQDNPEFIQKNFLTAINPYLDFQTVAASPRAGSSFKIEQLDLVLKFYKTLDYDFIIIDGGKNLTDVLLKIFDNANLIIFTATPDILSLYHTKWIIDTLQSLGFPVSMMKVILNRSQSVGGVSFSEVKIIIPIEIIFSVPSDGKAAIFALNRRIPVVLDNPKSKISLAISSLAKILAENENIYISHKELTDLRVKQENLPLYQEKTDIWSNLGLVESAHRGVGEEKEDPLVNLKQRVHRSLIESMNLEKISLDAMNIAQKRRLREKTEELLVNILAKEAEGIISSLEVRKQLIKEIVDEALGLGPLEDLLKDPEI